MEQNLSARHLLILCICVPLVFCGGGSGDNDSSTSNDQSLGDTNDDETNDSSDETNDTVDNESICAENDPGNGATIIDGPSGPEGSDTDHPFRSLAVHPNNAEIVLVGTERNGFVKSIDGGANWVRYREGLRHQGVYPEIWDIAFDPGNPDIIYAATLDSPGPITDDYPSAIAGVYKSIDGGQSWSRSSCGLSNSRVTSVRVSGHDSNIVIIGVEGGTASFTSLSGQYFNGGIYRSIDAGANWTKIEINSNDIKNGYWWLHSFGNSNEHFITFGLNYNNPTENLGFIQSTDHGLSWSLSNSALKNLEITAFAIASNGQTLFANERDSYIVQISNDGADSWTNTAINQANGPIAISPSNNDIIIYAGSSIIYRSTDGFSTAATTVLSAADTITDIVFAPSNANIVYAIARGYIFYKSTDAGASFSMIKNIRSEVLNN